MANKLLIDRVLDRITTPISNGVVKRMRKRDFVNEKGMGKTIEWFNKNVSSPENRLILGATALASQPFFDLNNKEVDEKTRVISTARTIAKIIAGTLSGVLIRYGYIVLTKRYSAVGKLGSKVKINVGRAGLEKYKEIIIKKSNQFFTPSEAKSHLAHEYEQYQNAMGTALGIVTMMFTNFLIDAPFTKFMTNKFIDKFTDVNTPSKKGGAE